jgi:uncharacterized membrane protein (UPF0127 family)/CheY-like chemotaxis protein
VIKTKLIVNLTRGEAVCVGKLADGPLLRMRGLLGLSGLPAGEGLLLSPAPAIHTAFMRFPIDALFLDRDFRVVQIVERLGPWRIASKRKARAVLELSAGECARRGVQVGDTLELRDRAEPGEYSAGGRDSVSVSLERESASTPGDNGRLARGGELTRLQPLRVLVVSPDRHFRTVMALLLARRNCSVATTARPSRVTELIAREAADVVVIDVSESPGEAIAAKVGSLAGARPVGVVLADELPSDSQPPVMAKWGPFRELMAAIELADERRAKGMSGS